MSASRSDSKPSSVAKPASSHKRNSVVKPVVCEEDVCVVFYNITWDNKKITGKTCQKGVHEEALKEDLDYAFDELDADAVFLSECGEIEYGLRPNLWMDLLRRIVPARFTSIIHQSHYTSIVDESRIKILVGPLLRGPMTMLSDHKYGMCQYLELKRKGSADKPIQVFNVHCPSSKQKQFKI